LLQEYRYPWMADWQRSKQPRALYFHLGLLARAAAIF
jgi:hypothetical protein